MFRVFEKIEQKAEVDTIGALAVLFRRIGLQCEALYLELFRLYWLLLAKLTPLLSLVIFREYGEFVNENEIDSFETTRYLVARNKV